MYLKIKHIRLKWWISRLSCWLGLLSHRLNQMQNILRYLRKYYQIYPKGRSGADNYLDCRSDEVLRAGADRVQRGPVTDTRRGRKVTLSLRTHCQHVKRRRDARTDHRRRLGGHQVQDGSRYCES